MNTERMKSLKAQSKEFMKGKELKISVINMEEINSGKIKVTSTFNNIERVLHKLELDIMTNAYFGLKNPILVKVEVRENNA